MKDRPFGFQALENNLRQTALAQEDIRRYAPSGRMLTWTPTVRGISLGNPTYTLTADSFGQYIVMNNVLFAWFHLEFATMAAGADVNWAIDLPESLAVAPGPIGSMRLYDASTGNETIGHLVGSVLSADIHAYMRYQPTLTTMANVGNSLPWSWAVGDKMSGNVTARLIDGFHPS